MKKLIRNKRVILAVIIIVIAFVTKTYLFNTAKSEDSKENQQVLDTETQYTKKILRDETLNVERIVESISEEIELVVLKEKGSIEIFHDKTPKNNRWVEWLVDSNINFRVYYTASLSMCTKSIEVYYDKNTDNINIIYDPNEIKVNSINIDNILSETSRSLFGKKYSEKEVSALTLLANEKIRETVSDDQSLNNLACMNLEGYLREIVYKLRIYNVNIMKK